MKMKNKILINLYIVDIDEYYNLYIPVNAYIGKIIELIVSSAFELADVEPSNKKYYLVNPVTGEMYLNSVIVRDSNIKNAKTIYLV